MAHLASVGCHRINGVSGLHTELLKKDVLRDFYALWPDKFVSITNGVTPRRWVRLSNPGLAQLITDVVGEDWIREPSLLRQLEPLAGDAAFRQRWREVKRANKQRLAAVISRQAGRAVDPASMFDVQVKRIHEYKRQHLNVLHVITLYNQLRRNPSLEVPPRTVIFGGKAAPGYAMAKLIIRLTTGVAEVVNADRGGGGPAGGRVSPRVQRQVRRARVSGRRPLRADLDRRTRGVRYRQHEVRDERRAHHRHARRRQRGASRGGRRRELLPVRAARRRSGGAQGRLTTVRPSATRPTTGLHEAIDQIACGMFSRGDRGDVPPVRRCAARTRRLPGARRLRGVRRVPGDGERDVSATSIGGRACRS